MQFATAHDFENIGAFRVFDAERYVGEQFLLQALTQISRCDVCAVASGKGRCIHRELHGDGGLVDGDRSKRSGIFRIGDGLADRNTLHSSNRDDVPECCFRDVGPLQSGEGEQLGDFCFLDRAVKFSDTDFFPGAHGSVEYAGDGKPAEVIAVIEIGYQDLQRAGNIAFGFRNCVQDGIEQRLQVFATTLDIS